MSLRRRNRKLLGAAIMIVFVVVWALVAMAVSQAGPLQEASKLFQGIMYAVLGIAWIIPIMPLIRWMENGRD
jgi:predicted membrane channel-forming protein YqfA (hemolysin III family)